MHHNFRRDKDVLALDALLETLGKTFANFRLVAVDIRGIDMSVARLKGMGDCVLDLSRLALPCSETGSKSATCTYSGRHARLTRPPESSRQCSREAL